MVTPFNLNLQLYSPDPHYIFTFYYSLYYIKLIFLGMIHAYLFPSLIKKEERYELSLFK